jgi:GNAT superfamily N-acetyltransferase
MTANEIPVVRPMQAGDAQAVLEMARALAAELSDPEPKLTTADLVSADTQRWFDCLVAEKAGRLVGYTAFCMGLELHTGHRRLWLGDLFVVANARRTGVAHALIAAVARRARELQCDAIYWELWKPNAVGRKFYEALGATQLDELAIMRLDVSPVATPAANPHRAH